jgi:dTDP-4-dehydrorhamnose reductase
MLGHVVAAWLRENGYEVMTSELRYGGIPHDPLVEAVVASEAPWVINAIGRIKQKSADPAELRLLNTYLPLHLAARLGRDQRLIQPSTDCVFDGHRGGYRNGEPPNAADDYGWSKALGERVAGSGTHYVFRTSIIGPELGGSAAGLMSWFLHQQAPVKGFTNHLWNGITTLTWAQWAERLICGTRQPAPGVYQLGVTEPVTKHALLELIGRVWGHAVPIHPQPAPEAVDRTLIPDWVCPPLIEQLPALRQWQARHP